MNKRFIYRCIFFVFIDFTNCTIFAISKCKDTNFLDIEYQKTI